MNSSKFRINIEHFYQAPDQHDQQKDGEQSIRRQELWEL